MKGIMMKLWKAKAIAESSPDRDWQTRLLITPQPYPEAIIEYGYYHPTKIDKDGEQYPGDEVFGAYTTDGEYGWIPPYQVGQVVYIKEAWRATPERIVDYRLDWDETIAKTEKWRSPLFMPAWAARTFIQITDVRPERLQEITPEDAVAEGAEYMPPAKLREERLTVSQIVFAGYWDSINPKAKWETNPFVWRYSFV